ncbi:MAG: L-2-amino-thiazoline-4-carboxylic acid hydrolase [Desulfurococcaceae archaeon]
MSRERTISLEEARQAVESVARRLALLHLAYARSIIDEIGQEKGMKIIAKAVKDYGRKIGEKTREEVIDQGLDPEPENFDRGSSYRFPGFGMGDRTELVNVEGELRVRTHGCTLAGVWKEHKGEKLGRLYCYMDVAKYMGYNPKYKLVHVKCILDGDDYCEFAVRPTTEKEREDFSSEGKDWFYIDSP